MSPATDARSGHAAGPDDTGFPNGNEKRRPTLHDVERRACRSGAVSATAQRAVRPVGSDVVILTDSPMLTCANVEVGRLFVPDV